MKEWSENIVAIDKSWNELRLSYNQTKKEYW
jgi:hypothetical protein